MLFWTFAVTVTLNAVIAFFNRTLWLMMLYCQTKFGCKRTSSLQEIVKIVMLIAGINCWLENRTHDQKIVSSNPGRSSGKIFFPRVKFVCWLIWCLFHPRVTAVASERPRSFCQKCRWQVTPNNAYTFDPTKLEWADYGAVQAYKRSLA